MVSEPMCFGFGCVVMDYSVELLGFEIPQGILVVAHLFAHIDLANWYHMETAQLEDEPLLELRRQDVGVPSVAEMMVEQSGRMQILEAMTVVGPSDAPW